VLIHSRGQPGANNRPSDTAAATSHSDTFPSSNRVTTAAAIARIAATASAHTDPTGSGITGSAATARTQVVNTARTASARPANRRNQSRTVSTGRPTTAAIRRNPNPDALAANASPITAAMSARRTSANTGSSTCVAPQPEHRDRRGRIHTGPSGPRTCRRRA
jgi:hypothetical protein